MRKLFTCCFIFIFSALFVNAQITKGSLLLGGGIGYNSHKNDTNAGTSISKQNNFFISPAIGVAVKENTIVGGDLYFGTQLQENINNNNAKYTLNSYGAGMYIRKYLPVAKRLYIFGQGRMGANYSNGKSAQAVDYKSTSKGYDVNIGIYPGVSFQVNKKLHLETGFNNLLYAQYSQTKTKTFSFGNETSSTINSFSAGTNLNSFSSLYVGFRLLLAK
jgi:hypothetical protein